MDLNTLTTTVRQLIADGHTDEAIAHIVRFAQANYNSELLDRATLLQSRYTKLLLDKSLMLPDTYQVELNKLEADILNLLRALHTQQQLIGTHGTPKQGRLLHNIPPSMALMKETRCIVRIAYSDDLIRSGLPDNATHEIVHVRTAEVMGVELIDPAETPRFNIRAINDEDQLIVCDDYTQWMFYVKPLVAGPHALLLKVSVVEMVEGIERRREVVLEKEVKVVAQAAETEVALQEDKAVAAFLPAYADHKSSAKPEATTAGAEPDAPAAGQVETGGPPSPTAGSKPPTHQLPPSSPPQPAPAKKNFTFRPFLVAASVAVLALLAVFVLMPASFYKKADDPLTVGEDSSTVQKHDPPRDPALSPQQNSAPDDKPITIPRNNQDAPQLRAPDGKPTGTTEIVPNDKRTPVSKGLPPRTQSTGPTGKPSLPNDPVRPQKPPSDNIKAVDARNSTDNQGDPSRPKTLPKPKEDPNITKVVLQLGSQHCAYEFYANGVRYEPVAADYLKFYYNLPVFDAPVRIKIVACDQTCHNTLTLRNNMLIKACDVKD